MVERSFHFKYKNTEIGEIPEDWNLSNIGQICHKPQYGLTTSASFNYNSIKFLRISDIQNGVVNWDTVPFCKCSKEVEEKYKLDNGDILFARTGATTGKSFIVKDPPPSIFASYLIKIRTKDSINPEFLFMYLNSDAYWKQIRQNISGSAQGGINAKLLAKILVPLPPQTQQLKVAKILSDMDSLIYLLEKKIEKKKSIKQGLMQKLLTKGIGNEKFKKAEIGNVPNDWRIYNLGDPAIVKKMKAGGTPLRSDNHFYENGTVLFVKIEDVVKVSKFLNDTIYRITEEGLNKSSSWLTPKDSILFSMYASYGEVCINTLPVATNQAIISIIPNNKTVDLNFLYYQLKYLKRFLNRYLQTTTQNNLNAEIVKRLTVAIPPLSEQQDIAKILSDADEEIELLKLKREKFTKIKIGLLQQLFTGRIRVK